MSGKNVYDKYTDEELQELHTQFMAKLKKATSPDRYEKLEYMYSDTQLGPSLVLSPASTKPYYHNAFYGGYMDHVLRVVDLSMQQAKLFAKSGGNVNFTAAELAFVAFHHDLGKLGGVDTPYYVLNKSDWHIKNRKEYFTHNEDLEHMPTSDRTFFLLQKYGIELSENEYFGIRLADGMYDDSNKSYLVQYTEDNVVRRNIANVIHWADRMATVIERELTY